KACLECAWSSPATTGQVSITKGQPRHQPVGAMPFPEIADQPRPTRSHSRWLVIGLEATDFSVAQTVEDQDKQLASGSDLPDPVAPPFNDPSLLRFDERFAVVAASHGVVGFRVCDSVCQASSWACGS
ncbi:MAG: hypothetical protein AAGK32_14995, partial [Actinomycetota bacterium]